jgi:hypothetical protein
MKLITVSIIIVLLLSLLIILASYEYTNNIELNNTTNNNSINTTNLSNTTNVSLTATPTDGNNSTLYLPPNDYVINNINWPLYPNLQKGYVSVSEISEPNSIVPHKFIEVQIHTEIINSDNETEIMRQLDSVAREARKIYGENSGINIYGDKHGIFYYSSSMIPYDDNMY